MSGLNCLSIFSNLPSLIFKELCNVVDKFVYTSYQKGGIQCLKTIGTTNFINKSNFVVYVLKALLPALACYWGPLDGVGNRNNSSRQRFLDCCRSTSAFIEIGIMDRLPVNPFNYYSPGQIEFKLLSLAHSLDKGSHCLKLICIRTRLFR